MHLSSADASRLELLRTATPNKWIALSADESKIIATADSFTDAAMSAEEAGESDPLILRVPADWDPQVLV